MVFLLTNQSSNFHLLGLSTNWKNLPLKEIVEFNSELRIKEPLIKELCEKARLVSIPQN